MDAVDHMKTIQKWSDTSIREFRDLESLASSFCCPFVTTTGACYNDANIAASWARYWRQEIQRYITPTVR